jgi:hypothetical protein
VEIDDLENRLRGFILIFMEEEEKEEWVYKRISAKRLRNCELGTGLCGLRTSSLETESTQPLCFGCGVHNLLE